MSRLNTDIQTDRHVNIELEFCEVLTEFGIKETCDKTNMKVQVVNLGHANTHMKLQVARNEFKSTRSSLEMAMRRFFTCA